MFISSKEQRWITFALPKIKELKNSYEETLQFIKNEYGLNFNLDYSEDIKKHVADYLGIPIKSAQINELKRVRSELLEGEDSHEHLTAIIEYLRLKWTIRNYCDCILNHADSSGTVILREDGKMPNRRPLPYLPDILECVKAHSGNIHLKRGETRWDLL